MNSSDAILKKLEDLLGPSPELLPLIERSNVDIKKTPYEIIQNIFNAPDIKIAKFYFSLSPACRRTFITAANLDRKYVFHTKETIGFFSLIMALPVEHLPMTKDDLLLVRTVLRTWCWKPDLFVLQVLIYNSLTQACENYENYGYKVHNLMAKLGFKAADVEPALHRSMRNILESMEKSRDEALAEFILKRPNRTWEPVLIADRIRFGHMFFKEIVSMDRMLELSQKYDNCLVGRISLALDGSRRYFEVTNRQGVIGFLEIEFTSVVVDRDIGYKIRQWKELDFVDAANEIVEHPTYRKNMLAFVAHLNEDMGVVELADYYEEHCRGSKNFAERATYIMAEMTEIPKLAKSHWNRHLTDRLKK